MQTSAGTSTQTVSGTFLTVWTQWGLATRVHLGTVVVTGTWAQFYVTFYVRNVRLFVSLSVCLWQVFSVWSNVSKNGLHSPSLTSGIGSWPYLKHQTWLERSARDKHSSIFLNYGRKTFYNIDTW